MSVLTWNDVLLMRAAVILARQGQDAVVNTLTEASTLEVAYATSWWDGFDDYIYDTRLTVAVSADGLVVLTASSETLRQAFRDVLYDFTDAQGRRRRGDLISLEFVETGRLVDEAAVQHRRADLKRANADSS